MVSCGFLAVFPNLEAANTRQDSLLDYKKWQPQNQKLFSSGFLQQKETCFATRRPENKSNSKVVESSPLRLPNEDKMYLHGASLSAQTRCLLWVQERRQAGSNGEGFCRGRKKKRDFSFESILLLFCLRRQVERNECSVFMGCNTKHVHTLTGAHTLEKTGSSISMR